MVIGDDTAESGSCCAGSCLKQLEIRESTGKNDTFVPYRATGITFAKEWPEWHVCRCFFSHISCIDSCGQIFGDLTRPHPEMYLRK